MSEAQIIKLKNLHAQLTRVNLATRLENLKNIQKSVLMWSGDTILFQDTMDYSHVLPEDDADTAALWLKHKSFCDTVGLPYGTSYLTGTAPLTSLPLHVYHDLLTVDPVFLCDNPVTYNRSWWQYASIPYAALKFLAMAGEAAQGVYFLISLVLWITGIGPITVPLILLGWISVKGTMMTGMAMYAKGKVKAVWERWGAIAIGLTSIVMIITLVRFAKNFKKVEKKQGKEDKEIPPWLHVIKLFIGVLAGLSAIIPVVSNVWPEGWRDFSFLSSIERTFTRVGTKLERAVDGVDDDTDPEIIAKKISAEAAKCKLLFVAAALETSAPTMVRVHSENVGEPQFYPLYRVCKDIGVPVNVSDSLFSKVNDSYRRILVISVSELEQIVEDCVVTRIDNPVEYLDVTWENAFKRTVIELPGAKYRGPLDREGLAEFVAAKAADKARNVKSHPLIPEGAGVGFDDPVEEAELAMPDESPAATTSTVHGPDSVPQAWEVLTFNRSVKILGISLSIVGVMLACVSLALSYTSRRRQRKEAAGYFRQIKSDEAQKSLLPVYSDRRTADNDKTGLVDTLVKVKFTSGTYFVCAAHVMDFDPYVVVRSGAAEKRVSLRDIAHLERKLDIAYVRADAIPVPGMATLTHWTPTTNSLPVVLTGFDPKDAKLFIGSSLAEVNREKNSITYDCDTFNYNCGTAVRDATNLAHVCAIHVGTNGPAKGNYGTLLQDPATCSLEKWVGSHEGRGEPDDELPTRRDVHNRVQTTAPFKSTGASKGQNMKAAAAQRDLRERNVKENRAERFQRDMWKTKHYLNSIDNLREDRYSGRMDDDSYHREIEEFMKLNGYDKQDKWGKQEYEDFLEDEYERALNKQVDSLPDEHRDEWRDLRYRQDALYENAMYMNASFRDEKMVQLDKDWTQFYDKLSTYEANRRATVRKQIEAKYESSPLPTGPKNVVAGPTDSVLLQPNARPLAEVPLSQLANSSQRQISQKTLTQPQPSRGPMPSPNSPPTKDIECQLCPTVAPKLPNPPSNTSSKNSGVTLTEVSSKPTNGKKQSKQPTNNSGISSSVTKNRRKKRSRAKSTGAKPVVTQPQRLASVQKLIGGDKTPKS
jgi:hypothetical protein